MRGLEDADYRVPEARANSTADKSRKFDTSPQKETELNDNQKNTIVTTMMTTKIQKLKNQKDGMSIQSQGDKTKSNKTSMFPKTSSVTSILTKSEIQT